MPRIAEAPGFLSYGIVRADNGDALSISTFESRTQAEESIQTAAGWVKENLGPLLPHAPEVVGGEVRVRRVGPQAAEARYGVMRLYRGVRDVDDLARRVETGFVPIVGGLPGFGAYSVLDAGARTAISLSAFRDREAAERSTEAAAEWVRENLADLILGGPPEVTTGEILGERFRTG